MWLMLQQDAPDDYVIATGVMRSVQEFVEAAFAIAGLDSEKYVVVDEASLRPADVDELRGDASKACGGHIFIGQADYAWQRLPEPIDRQCRCSSL